MGVGTPVIPAKLQDCLRPLAMRLCIYIGPLMQPLTPPHALELIPPKAGLMPYAAVMRGCEAFYCENSRRTRNSPRARSPAARASSTAPSLLTL